MHLFAGIGGGLLADLIIGHKPIIAVEWDKYACRVLRERATDGWFPDLSVYEGDVRLFDPSEYEGRIHTLHAGFPCQDISNAGKQAGVGEGTRSGLYREVLRIASVVRPYELYLENVSAILSNGLGTVLGDLAALGYDAKWICIRASDVGANHQRDRWWLLARKIMVDSEGERIRGGERDIHQADGRQNGELRVEPISASIEQENLADSELCRQLHGQPEIKPAEGGVDALSDVRTGGEDVAYTNSTQCDRKRLSITDEQEQLATRGYGDVFNTECKGLERPYNNAESSNGIQQEFSKRCKDVSDPTSQRQSGQGKHERCLDTAQDCDREASWIVNSGEGNANWWKSEPDICRVVNGVSSRVDKLKGLGNAQVPLQAAIAYKMLERLYETY